MASPFSGSNIRRLLRETYSPIIGFFVCFILAIFIQLIGFGIGIVIAGILAGFMMKKTWKALATTFLAGFAAWLALFGYMYLLYPDASRNAWVVLSSLIPAPQVFVSLIGGALTAVGGQLGSLFADIAYGGIPDDMGLPPGPERIPTKELPRRKRVKGKKPRRKKKKRKY
jgi:hypothetical protein